MCSFRTVRRGSLKTMTMGMVYDMLTEEGNDREEYPYQATQEDIKAFFG